MVEGATLEVCNKIKLVQVRKKRDHIRQLYQLKVVDTQVNQSEVLLQAYVCAGRRLSSKRKVKKVMSKMKNNMYLHIHVERVVIHTVILETIVRPVLWRSFVFFQRFASHLFKLSQIVSALKLNRCKNKTHIHLSLYFLLPHCFRLLHLLLPVPFSL